MVPRRKKQRVKDHRHFGITGWNPTWCMQDVWNLQCSVVTYRPMPHDDPIPKPRIPIKTVKSLTTTNKRKQLTVHTRFSLWSVSHVYKRTKNIVQNARALLDDNFSYFFVQRVSPRNRRHCSPWVFKLALRTLQEGSSNFETDLSYFLRQSILVDLVPKL